MDYVSALGPAFVAHRLRRLSDRIVDDIAEALAREGLRVPPRSVSTLLLLAERGPLGPVDIARTLRFSHPLMVRALRTLEQLGLIQAVVDLSDQRRRRVELTPSGREEAAALARFNHRLDHAVRDLLDEGGGSAETFLATLEALDGALDRLPITTRLHLKEDA